MYCSNCGKKLSEGDYFCPNCGTPVSRQGLFDDDQNNATNDDAMEETRVFSAQDLEQFLKEDEEAAAAFEEKERLAKAARQKDKQHAPKVSAEKVPDKEPSAKIEEDVKKEEVTASPKKSIDIGAKVGGAAAAAGVLGKKWKDKLGDAKVKRDEKKQEKVAEKAKKKVAAAEKKQAAAQAVPETAEDDVKPVSFAKVAIPVVIFGVIIGLVFGLVLIQPWKSSEDNADAEGGVIIVDQMMPYGDAE
ncbi:MAG: zinc-ribbon domain-containing protein [Peptococcaceae bacterium]|nr:zinc-ribbon domain-containing protein [Peptococcaceae bacterium]